MEPEVAPAQATKTRSGFGVDELAGERRELGGVLGDEHGVSTVAPCGAEDGLDGGDVALAERVVLREDDDLLALEVVDEGAGGGDVLQALAAGAEGVVVDARDGVGGGRAGDVEDLVLRGLLGELQGDAGRRGAGEDLVVLCRSGPWRR